MVQQVLNQNGEHGATDITRARRDPLQAIWLGLRREFFWILLLSLIINITLTGPMLYMLQVYDRVIISGNEFTLLGITGLLMIALGFMTIAERARSTLLIKVGERLDIGMSDLLMRAAFVGELLGKRANMHQIFADLRQLQQSLSGAGMFALFDMPWLPIYLGILYLLHPVLGLIALCFSIVQLIATMLMQVVINRAALEAERNDMQLNDMLFRRLRHVETVEAMGMVARLRARWLELSTLQRLTAERYEKLSYRLGLVGTLMKQAQPSLILGAGALLAIQGEISLGAMAAAQMLMAKTLQPIDQVIAAWPQLGSAKLAYERLKTLLKAPYEHPGVWEANTASPSAGEHAASTQAPAGALELLSVKLKPPGDKAPVLYPSLSMRFEEASITAIVGPSGVGKSTLAKVIVGVWPVQGDVHWGGVPVQRWDRLGLRESIGYLPQDVVLMEGSVAENIGRFEENNHEKIVEAAKAAGVHEMILRLPQGYDSAVGEGGGYLSAGQRQRLALARALYGGARLLVLDEPNASLDPAGEEALGRALLHVKSQGAIVIVITHREGLLRFCDAVLDLGQWLRPQAN